MLYHQYTNGGNHTNGGNNEGSATGNSERSATQTTAMKELGEKIWLQWQQQNTDTKPFNNSEQLKPQL